MSDSSQSEKRRWKSAAAADIAWAGWEDSYVAYHRPSGRTHFLNSSSFFLVTEFLQSERDLDAVAESLEPDLEPADRESLRRDLHELLEQLEHAGLIKRA